MAWEKIQEDTQPSSSPADMTVTAPKVEGAATSSSPVPKGPLWEKLKPEVGDYSEIIDRAAKKYNLDPLLLKAQMLRESGGNPYAVSKAGAQGLFQLMPGTAGDLKVTDPFDPEQSIFGGAQYMRQLLDRKDVNGDYGKALLYYVGGRDPQNWGAQSFAYPHLVYEKYRELGGKKEDPDIKPASLLDVAANAAVPFVSAPEVIMQAVKGRGPDLSQGPSGPDGNLPVGAKLARWWRGESAAQPQINAFRDSLAKRKAQNESPLLDTAVELGASLPGQMLLGGAANAGLKAAGSVLPAIAPLTNFLSGAAGHGLPGTREGASLLTRLGSAGAQGALQGGLSGAAGAHLSPEESLLGQAGQGALIGGMVGPTLQGVGEGMGRAIFGPKIHPKVAQLGQEAVAGAPDRPPLKLSPDSSQVNQLSLSPQELSRKTVGLFGESAPMAGPKAVDAAGARIGDAFDHAARNSVLVVDRQLITDMNSLLGTLDDEIAAKPALRFLNRTLNRAALTGQTVLSGEKYQELTKTGSELQKAISQKTNPALATAAKEAKKLLDDSLERGAQLLQQQALALGNPQIAAQATEALNILRNAKQDYKGYMTVRDVADPITGEFAPKQLQGAVEKHFRGADRYGGGPMGEYARYGQAFDPSLKKQGGLLSALGLSVPAIAGIGSAATAAPFHTTAVAAGLAGLYGMGKAAKGLVSSAPGYTNALLSRSANVGQGPVQAALQGAGVPLAVGGGRTLELDPPPMPKVQKTYPYLSFPGR